MCYEVGAEVQKRQPFMVQFYVDCHCTKPLLPSQNSSLCTREQQSSSPFKQGLLLLVDTH